MRRLIGIVAFIFCLVPAMGQTFMEEIAEYRKEQHAEFLNPEKSPLTAKQKRKFKGHDFYEPNEAYRVTARFEATPESKPFPLATSRGGTRLYKRIGILHFEIKGNPYTLEAYLQVPKRFAPKPEKVYVFLPLVDETTGDETYGAGRYLHYEGIPEGKEWVVDFNKLYNPYCAYSERYDCPKVPVANHLPIAIEAGVKDYNGKK